MINLSGLKIFEKISSVTYIMIHQTKTDEIVLKGPDFFAGFCQGLK